MSSRKTRNLQSLDPRNQNPLFTLSLSLVATLAGMMKRSSSLLHRGVLLYVILLTLLLQNNCKHLSSLPPPPPLPFIPDMQVWHHLQNARYGDEDDQIGILRLLQNGCFNNAFPLHDVCQVLMIWRFLYLWKMHGIMCAVNVQ